MLHDIIIYEFSSSQIVHVTYGILSYMSSQAHKYCSCKCYIWHMIIYEFSSSQIVYVNVTHGIIIYEFSSSQFVHVNVTWHNNNISVLKFTNCACKGYTALLYMSSQVLKLFM
jgi:hypothetical protein